jgi:hypothetical protein
MLTCALAEGAVIGLIVPAKRGGPIWFASSLNLIYPVAMRA